MWCLYPRDLQRLHGGQDCLHNKTKMSFAFCTEDISSSGAKAMVQHELRQGHQTEFVGTSFWCVVFGFCMCVCFGGLGFFLLFWGLGFFFF